MCVMQNCFETADSIRKMTVGVGRGSRTLAVSLSLSIFLVGSDKFSSHLIR